MNYAKMITILVAVKANRIRVAQGEPSALGTSPYVCDNLQRYAETHTRCITAVRAIRADIECLLGSRFFGVPDFLGLDCGSPNFGNDHPDVLTFRAKMIDDLIARYTTAKEAA